MQATAGDRIIVRSVHVGEHERDGEVLEVQSHRQVGKLGQAEGFVTGRLRLGGGQAFQHHMVDVEAADPEFAAEQGAGRPIQLRLIDVQPNAVVVGNGKVMDGDVQAPA